MQFGERRNTSSAEASEDKEEREDREGAACVPVAMAQELEVRSCYHRTRVPGAAGEGMSMETIGNEHACKEMVDEWMRRTRKLMTSTPH